VLVDVALTDALPLMVGDGDTVAEVDTLPLRLIDGETLVDGVPDDDPDRLVVLDTDDDDVSEMVPLLVGVPVADPVVDTVVDAEMVLVRDGAEDALTLGVFDGATDAEEAGDTDTLWVMEGVLVRDSLPVGVTEADTDFDGVDMGVARLPPTMNEGGAPLILRAWPVPQPLSYTAQLNGSMLAPQLFFGPTEPQALSSQSANKVLTQLATVFTVTVKMWTLPMAPPRHFQSESKPSTLGADGSQNQNHQQRGESEGGSHQCAVRWQSCKCSPASAVLQVQSCMCRPACAVLCVAVGPATKKDHPSYLTQGCTLQFRRSSGR
jgi:hypothetical protein